MKDLYNKIEESANYIKSKINTTKSIQFNIVYYI